MKGKIELTDDVERALKKASLSINGVVPWEHAPNRAALVAILQAASISGKPNIDNIYPSLINKLTCRSCKRMPNFVGQLRRSGLVHEGPNKLQWQSDITLPKNNLLELWKNLQNK